MSTGDDISVPFRVRRTVHEMLADRGYIVHDSDLKITREEFVERFGSPTNREQLTVYVQKRDDPSECILVFFPDEKKVGVKPIRSITDRMKQQGVRRAIIVVQQGMTPFARQALVEMSAKFQLEWFKESELLVNITHHELVPQHVPLSAEHKKALLERFKMKETQLPRMQVVDPVARYYGLERGRVVKIIRPSETAGQYVTYRLVV